MAEHQLSNLLQLSTRHRAPCGVRRKIQHQHFAARGDGLLDRFGADCETKICSAWNGHRYPVCHGDPRRIAHIARLVVEDLIPGIDHGSEGKVHRLADANRNQNFAFWIVANLKMFMQTHRNGFAQFEQTQVGSVAGSATFQCVDRRFPNVPGSHEIRLTHTKGNDILHALNDVEKVSNPRAWNCADIGSDEFFRLKWHRHAVESNGKLTELTSGQVVSYLNLAM